VPLAAHTGSISPRRPDASAHRAPQLGEHTDAVLTELGYDAAGIAGLRAARA